MDGKEGEVIELRPRTFPEGVTSDDYDIWRKLALAEQESGYPVKVLPVKTTEEAERIGGDQKIVIDSTDPEVIREISEIVKYCKEKEIFKVFMWVFQKKPDFIRKIIEEKIQEGSAIEDLTLLTASYLTAFDRRNRTETEGKASGINHLTEEERKFYEFVSKVKVEGNQLRPLAPEDMDGYLMRLVMSGKKQVRHPEQPNKPNKEFDREIAVVKEDVFDPTYLFYRGAQSKSQVKLESIKGESGKFRVLTASDSMQELSEIYRIATVTDAFRLLHIVQMGNIEAIGNIIETGKESAELKAKSPIDPNLPDKLRGEIELTNRNLLEHLDMDRVVLTAYQKWDKSSIQDEFTRKRLSSKFDQLLQYFKLKGVEPYTEADMLEFSTLLYSYTEVAYIKARESLPKPQPHG